MTVFDWSSSHRPSSFEYDVLDNDDVFEARSGARQIQGNSGARWRASAVWNNPSDTTLRYLRNRIAAAQGLRHRIRVTLAIFSNYTLGGVAATTPTVDGAHSAGATSLAVANSKLSTSGIWLAGDFISIGDQLHMLSTDYDSDGTGDGTVSVWPPLHKAYTGGEAIEQTDPQCSFFVMSHTGLAWYPGSTQRARQVTLELEQDVLA